MLSVYYSWAKTKIAGVRNEKGATAVEYGIMVAAIAAVIIGIVITVGGQVETAFTDVSTALLGL